VHKVPKKKRGGAKKRGDKGAWENRGKKVVVNSWGQGSKRIVTRVTKKAKKRGGPLPTKKKGDHKTKRGGHKNGGGCGTNKLASVHIHLKSMLGGGLGNQRKNSHNLVDKGETR